MGGDSVADQKNYGSIVWQLFGALELKETVLLVHCKSGKDRSPFTVYALLRIIYGLREDAARELLAHRVDIHGRPVVNLDQQHEANLTWLAAVMENV